MIERANAAITSASQRLGWDRAFRGNAQGWGSGTRHVTATALDVHIDGASALPAIVAAVRGARSFVHVAGWTVNPDFAMERDSATCHAASVAARDCPSIDVRVLAWAGAPVPVMHPTRTEAQQLIDRLTRNTHSRRP